MTDKRTKDVIEYKDYANGTKYTLHENDDAMMEILIQLKTAEKTIQTLLADEKVKTYLDSLKKIKDLKIELEQLEEQKQKTCTHLVWYYWRGEQGDMYDPTMWLCRCITCGHAEWGKPNSFNYVICDEYGSGLPRRNLLSYDEVVKEYRNLQLSASNFMNKTDIEKNLSIISKILVLKLNPTNKKY